MHQKTSSNQKVFNNQYQIVKKLSSGSFGVVFLGNDLLTKQEVAIKVEKEENEEVRSLEREVQILKKLDGAEGFPKYFWSGEDQGYNILVIQLLGKDLAYHFKQLKKFSLKTVLTLGIQAVQILERSHQKGVIHRDLKPENMILGVGREISKLYLIDFGISKIYRDANGKHISFKEQKSFLGTTRYASIAAHLGHELGRKDDLESLMYILLYFLRGYQVIQQSRQLPWQNMVNVTDDERTKKVGEMKLSLEHELFKDQTGELQRVYDYIRRLQFKQEPNYKMILQELKRAADSTNTVIDGNFDWTEIKSSTHYQTDTNQNLSRNNIPLNSNEMKKSIEKQLSGLVQHGSNNLLAPPPVGSARNAFQRDDIRKNSSLTQQSSINYCQSLNPNYQKSVCEEPLNEEQQRYYDFDSVEISENQKTDSSLHKKYDKMKMGIFVHFLPKTIKLK
ncbi:unnamed protein product (macronuclear) [Paramecium tetraurelia]|uniref:Casein kinase I n=1 Tax=Paramecium tetraurelia TaxID=5888 RepID=A0E8A8_PARTE|nr:uncharacterized protein GSPATT00024253001 [Paramecium tetraurelia]CAK91525.1 unnamed protein product [Paramecium tetraurelia]|eukprot:XP_001458922.1 hypothetical protein (macronuclear) [Paramecium tetraurelia strain d4-2]